MTWTNTGGRPGHRALLFLTHHGPANRMISRMYTSARDRFADDA
ncbi:hypothetical protein [Actinoplanes italicus]|nr:hypothetical protein [Actinoplanes italicus]